MADDKTPTPAADEQTYIVYTDSEGKSHRVKSEDYKGDE